MVKLFSGREEQWVSFNVNGDLPSCILLLALLLLPYVLSITELYQEPELWLEPRIFALAYAEAWVPPKNRFFTLQDDIFSISLYIMTDFKFRWKLHRECFLKYICTFLENKVHMEKDVTWKCGHFAFRKSFSLLKTQLK